MPLCRITRDAESHPRTTHWQSEPPGFGI